MRNFALLALALLLVAIPCVLSPSPLPAQDRSAGEQEPVPRERSVRSKVIGLVRGSEEEPGALESAPGANTATLRRGWIPVVDLLRFIEETTGQPVVYPSASRDPSFGPDAGIHFLADQEGFDAGTARFYLERNGYEFAAVEIAPERNALVVTSRFLRSPVPRGIPTAEFVIGPDEPIPAAAAGTRAILVVALDHPNAGPLSQTLRELFDQHSTVSTTYFFAVPGSTVVLALAPVEQLATIRETVALLDVDLDTPVPPKATPAEKPGAVAPSGSGN